ncbi:TPA: zinc metallopeptidase [Candidatus Acetothermia bacterium]|nr:zinc metallopeptidase [Candidatus Acetothermia bacterium]
MLWLLMGPEIFILIPALILALYAQYKVKSTYAKYARIRTAKGVSAGAAAKQLLDRAGISDVKIERARRTLGDHYDPRHKVLRLSDPNSSSVAAVGVAAHEVGHAIQHAHGYQPLAVRTLMVPAANLGSQLAFPLFFAGLLFRNPLLLDIGIIAFSAAVLFTLVTLPVEFNASSRAIGALRSSYIVSENEIGAVKRVLSAAALTYVAAVAMAILQLLVLLARRR